MLHSALTPTPRALSLGHFRKIAENGFGGGRNSYSWSCAWYDGHAYIGTCRNVLSVSKMRGVIAAPMAAFPVHVPETEQNKMWRAHIAQMAQIWRYSPDTQIWERVYRSPLIRNPQGQTIPLALGFRNMAVFQGRSDARPAIYTIPNCGSLGFGPQLLRSADGVHFEIASEPGLGLGDTNVVSYRGAVPFKGRLFISPVGSKGLAGNTSYNPTVLCSDDPVSGRWEVSNPGQFSDPNNHGIFEMGASRDFLYAGTINIREGFQVWKTDGEGPPPHRWTKVVDRGADRGPHNQAIGCFAPHGDAMYIGTGIQNGGYDRLNSVGPAAGEILRLYPDDTWDLVMGEPRMTRSGFKTPSSGLGPGFDNEFNGYIWRMTNHQGTLYAGTFDAARVVTFTDPTNWPPTLRRLLDDGMLERYLKARGGCEVWRSTNGDDWTPVTLNGFGNHYNWGIRVLLSTPRGLFVGTANPFGPEVAVRGPAGWRYEFNPQGGTEIWHGSVDHAGLAAQAEESVQPGFDLWPTADDSLRRACPGWFPYDVEWISDLSAPGNGESEDLIRALTDLACQDENVEPHDSFAVQALEAVPERHARADPVQQLARIPAHLVGLTEDVACEIDQYFGGGPCNVGYWHLDTKSPRQATRQLVRELLAYLPPELGTRRGAKALILGTDTAGHAREAERVCPLLLFTPAAAPAEVVLQELADATYDLVIWLGGPDNGHRAASWAEAARVLRPGGRFVGCVLPVCSLEPNGPVHETRELVEMYRTSLADAGFDVPQVEDVTHTTWVRFYQHSREYFAAKLLLQQLDREQHNRILAALPGGNAGVDACLLASAIRR